MNEVAILAGASGLVGSFLCRSWLEQDPRARLCALVRRPLVVARTTPEQANRILEWRMDFSRLEEEFSERARAELVTLAGAPLFCALGTTIKKAGSEEAFRKVDFDAVLAFARAGRAMGARRFYVVTAMGSNPRSRLFYNRVKGEVEQALREIGFSELHIFRPSLLLGPREEVRMAERIAEVVMKPLSAAMVGPLKKYLAKYRPIHAETVARAMVRVAREMSEEPSREDLQENSKVAGVERRIVRVYESDEIALLGARSGDHLGPRRSQGSSQAPGARHGARGVVENSEGQR